MAPPIEIGNSPVLRRKIVRITIVFNLTQIILLSIFTLLPSLFAWVPNFTEESLLATETLVAITIFSNALHAAVHFYCAGVEGDAGRLSTKHRGNVPLLRTKLRQITKGVLLVFSSTLIFHLVAILFGAPLTENASETFHFSLMLTATAVVPGCLALGTNLDNWLRVFTLNKPANTLERQVLITSCCSIVGAWLGAFPIPLDWDRPWQVWPVSCVYGILIGYITGLVLSSFYFVWLQSKYKSKSI